MANCILLLSLLVISTTAAFAQIPVKAADLNSDVTAHIDLIRKRAIAMFTGQSSDTPGPYTRQAIAELNEQSKDILAKPLPDLSQYTTNPEGLDKALAACFSQLAILAQTYRAPGGELQGSAEVKKRIEQGLELALSWVQPGKPEPGNWYYWQIDHPRNMGTLGLVMGDDLRPDLKHLLITALDSQVGEMVLTSSNLAWQARNHLFLALMKNDPDQINAAAEKVFGSIFVSADSGGIVEDYSYLFHGKMLYTGGYGASYAEITSQFIYLFDNTPWAAPDLKKRIIANFLVHHAQWTIIRDFMDISVVGRSYMSNHPSDKLIEAMILMAFTDSELKQQLIEASVRLVKQQKTLPLSVATLADRLPNIEVKPLTGFRYFYTSNFAVFRRPDFHVSVRQYSDLTQDYEYLTHRGGEGWNLSNGLTHITRFNDEWWTPDNDQPIKNVDTDRLPGTTSRIGANPENPVAHISNKGYSLNFGRSGYSGGAGDGENGMAGFILIPTYGDFVAHKSYFFFDQGFVALGSGIRSTADRPEPINTTVAQWATPTYDAPLHLDGQRFVTPSNQPTVYENVNWAWLDHIGYIFPNPVTMHGKRQQRMTTLWLDHGSNPENATYAYIVLPNTTLEQTKSFAANCPVKILDNSPTVHAVSHQSATGRVFFTPGTQGDLTVNHPAIVYKDGDALAVQNPLHTQATIMLSHGTADQLKVTTVDTANGRVYRLGSKSNPPREDLLTFKNFRIDVENDPKQTIFTVHLPADLGDETYRLIVHGYKGHGLCNLTAEDLIDRPSPHTARYRWVRTPKGKSPETSQVAGSFRLSIRTEDRFACVFFSVPAYDKQGNEIPDADLPADANRPPWTMNN